MRRAICTLLVTEPSITVSGEVCSYSELLKFLSESTPNVILLDIHMGDQRNVDVGYLKAQLHGSCLLAMSVWDDEATGTLAQTYGAVKLLDKSTLALTLMPAIEECMRLEPEQA